MKGLVLKLQRNASAHVTLTAGEKLRPSGAAEKFNYSIDESGVDITNSDSLFFCPPLPSSFSITLSITGNNVNLFVSVRKLDFTCHSWELCTFFKLASYKLSQFSFALDQTVFLYTVCIDIQFYKNRHVLVYILYNLTFPLFVFVCKKRL